ncbi:hypothetical protein ACJ73_05365 [Blastomyces percursus]|uniref:Uncharacterized protein n=1 Tax=Blastomyces percursus TaxID=1658174 RepID=A0A1J9Q443_9EURO|nr:hypothetical protein ACJ73_05365 [Blastomyces percursus]
MAAVSDISLALDARPMDLSAKHSRRQIALGLHIGYDIVVGGFRTPKSSFTISRCAKKGRTEPIYRSTVSFNSSDGHLAADGTWQSMDSHSNGPWSNEYPAGGRDCESAYTRAVTVLGNDTENYFATIPFTVHAGLREGGRNYTWNNGDHTASRTTLVFSNMLTGNAAVGLRPTFSDMGAGVQERGFRPRALFDEDNRISLKAAYAVPMPSPPLMPASPIGEILSQLPRLRRIIWRRRKHNHEYDVRRISKSSHREAVLIQTRGQSVCSYNDMCTGCQSGCGPFTICVVAKANVEGSPRSGACANCVWRSVPGECSLRQASNRDTESG